MKHTKHKMNHRLISGLLVFMMLLSLVVGNAFALEVEETGSMDSYTTDTYREYRAWSTADSRWADLKMGTGTATVKKEGSAVVGITKLIIQAGIADESTLTPKEFVDYLNANGGFTASGGLFWGAPNGFTTNTYGKSFTRVAGGAEINKPIADYIDTILGDLKKGYHILLAVVDPSTNSSYHWVAVDECRSLAENALYIMDCRPDTGKNVNILATDAYTTLTTTQCYTGGSTHTHSYTKQTTDPTCTQTGLTQQVCTDCGESYDVAVTAALGHKFGTPVITIAPTCTQQGESTATCERCPATQTADIPATGHTYVVDSVTAPTCTTQGYTHYKCACGDEYDGDYVPATGHTFVDTVVAPTCTTQGYTQHECACGYKYNDDYVPATGHTFVDTVVKCTPLEDGYTEHACACGYSYKDHIVPAHTHSYPATWSIDVPSTATTPGTRYHICENPQCDERETASIPWVNPFTDVAPDAYYYIPVLWAAGRTPAITAGTSPTTYSPEDACTRGQVVTFLWRAAGEPAPSSPCPFTDVNSSDYYYKAVLWAVENGITIGTSSTTFSPNNYVTRAEFVTFLWRYAGMPSPSITSSFVDVDSSDYYYDAVLWAIENKITYGMDATHFNPTGYCRRGQVACFLYRYLGE